MAFRELRNFKEIMCHLGYPRLISIENFKLPHFELVADILVWLCHRYDKNMEILDEIRTEHDRVAFLKSVAEQLLVKARVKLNLKNLYSANGFAVRELLKVATLLYEAHRTSGGEDEDETAPADIGPGHQFADVKLTRQLTAEITKYGSRLHESLGQHADAKDGAARALGRHFDVDSLQRQLHEMIAHVEDQTEQLRATQAGYEADETNLQQKIDKKKLELDRHEKRLASLQTVRPAFMDEYERLEAELASQYASYVQSWRNLSYLEGELESISSHEAEQMAENERQLEKMQKRLREEELRILRGQTKLDERALDEALLTNDLSDDAKRQFKRPHGAAASGRGGGFGSDPEMDGPPASSAHAAYGGMRPIEDDESEDDDDDEADHDDDDEEGELLQRADGDGDDDLSGENDLDETDGDDLSDLGSMHSSDPDDEEADDDF